MELNLKRNTRKVVKEGHAYAPRNCCFGLKIFHPQKQLAEETRRACRAESFSGNVFYKSAVNQRTNLSTDFCEKPFFFFLFFFCPLQTRPSAFCICGSCRCSVGGCGAPVQRAPSGGAGPSTCRGRTVPTAPPARYEQPGSFLNGQMFSGI